MSSLPVPPASPTPLQPTELIIAEVAGLLGFENDPEMRTKAIRALDRAAARMNSLGVYLFRLKEAAFTTFNSGESTLTLPTDWGWAETDGFVYDEDGNLKSRLTWLAWSEFLLRKPNATTSSTDRNGIPQIISFVSEADGLAYYYPYIDSARVSRIVLPYLARVQRISEIADDSELSLSDEMREALIAGGQAFLMQSRYKDKPAIYSPYFAQFESSVRGAKATAQRRQHVYCGWAKPRL